MENESSADNSELKEKIRALTAENENLRRVMDTVEKKTRKLSDDFADKHLYSFTDKGWVDTDMFGDKIKPKDDLERKNDDFNNKTKSSNEAGKSSNETVESVLKSMTKPVTEPTVEPKPMPIVKKKPEFRKEAFRIEGRGIDMKIIPASEKKASVPVESVKHEMPIPIQPKKQEKPLTVEGLNKQLMDIIQLITKSKAKST